MKSNVIKWKDFYGNFLKPFNNVAVRVYVTSYLSKILLKHSCSFLWHYLKMMVKTSVLSIIVSFGLSLYSVKCNVFEAVYGLLKKITQIVIALMRLFSSSLHLGLITLSCL